MSDHYNRFTHCHYLDWQLKCNIVYSCVCSTNECSPLAVCVWLFTSSFLNWFSFLCLSPTTIGIFFFIFLSIHPRTRPCHLKGHLQRSNNKDVTMLTPHRSLFSSSSPCSALSSVVIVIGNTIFQPSTFLSRNRFDIDFTITYLELQLQL